MMTTRLPTCHQASAGISPTLSPITDSDMEVPGARSQLLRLWEGTTVIPWDPVCRPSPQIFVTRAWTASWALSRALLNVMLIHNQTSEALSVTTTLGRLRTQRTMASIPCCFLATELDRNLVV